jgi:uncharacterized protein YcbX
MLTISELFVYPIKSLGGMSVTEAQLTDRGFKYDRRWMLVDCDNRFLTQREFAQMALLDIAITNDCLRVTEKNTNDVLDILFDAATGETAIATIWDDLCEVAFVSAAADSWFSEKLSSPCRLVFMPDTTKRTVEEAYIINQEITSLSDGYPLLIIGQSSLDDLNSRLESSLPMNRFRPNIVFTGGDPYEEDELHHFMINDIHFYGVKLCARCAITTIDQDNASKAKEPLRTLATYRKKDNQVYFGQNLLYHGTGTLSVGNELIKLDDGL